MRTHHYLLAAPLAALALPVLPTLHFSNSQDSTGHTISTGSGSHDRNGDIASKQSKRFTLALEENVDYAGNDGPLELVRAHAKFTRSLPTWVANVARNRSDVNSAFHTYLQQIQSKLCALDEYIYFRKKLTKNIDGDDRGTISASPPAAYDAQYVVPVDIGTPPQRVHLNLDTGSGDLLVVTLHPPC